MPMQPRPMAETAGPVEPNLRCSMMALLEIAADAAALHGVDMRRFDCADKLDNPERLVHYSEQWPIPIFATSMPSWRWPAPATSGVRRRKSVFRFRALASACATWRSASAFA